MATSQTPSRLTTLIAANLKAARAASGMTQLQLANAAHCDPDQVSKWERARLRPSDANLAALAHALDMAIADFYVENEREAA